MDFDILEPGSHLVANVVELLGHVYTHTHMPVSFEEPIRRAVPDCTALYFPVLQGRGDGKFDECGERRKVARERGLALSLNANI